MRLVGTDFLSLHWTRRDRSDYSFRDELVDNENEPPSIRDTVSNVALLGSSAYVQIMKKQFFDFISFNTVTSDVLNIPLIPFDVYIDPHESIITICSYISKSNNMYYIALR